MSFLRTDVPPEAIDRHNFKKTCVALTSVTEKVADRDLIGVVPEGSWLKDPHVFVKPPLRTLKTSQTASGTRRCSSARSSPKRILKVSMVAGGEEQPEKSIFKSED